MADESKVTGGIVRKAVRIGEEDPPALVVPPSKGVVGSKGPFTREWLGVWPRQNGKTAISEHINALQARIEELESQRDAVLAACDRVEHDEPSAVFSQGGPVWAIWTADIRAAYEEDEDDA